jgi:hypothetical protein
MGLGGCVSTGERNRLLFSDLSPFSLEAPSLPFVIPTGADPDFLLRDAGNGHVCGSP